MYNSKPNKETQIKYLTHVSHKYSFHKSQTIKIIISLWTPLLPLGLLLLHFRPSSGTALPVIFNIFLNTLQFPSMMIALLNKTNIFMYIHYLVIWISKGSEERKSLTMNSISSS